MRTRIGPSWLIVLTLGYGILEIFWVLYLLFFQDRSGTAHHAHLAAAGLAIGGSALAVLTTGLVLRSRPWALVAAVMTATWLAATLFLALVLTHVAVVYASLPGILAALVITRSLLLGRWPHRVWAWLLVAVAALLLVHLGFVLASTGTSFHADRLRLLIVLYDSAEVAALLGLGLSLRSGAARAAILFGASGLVLFLLDAWVNLTVVAGQQAVAEALLYAIVGEVPAMVMCGAGVVVGMRHWRGDAHRDVGQAPAKMRS